MQSITLDNFRVFNASAVFDLAPITILTGKNNSGKSSLIKAFLVLADYLEQDDQTVLRLDGPRASKHKITSFAQLLNRQNNSAGKYRVRLGYTKGQYKFCYEFSSSNDSQQITAAFNSFQLINQADGSQLNLTREEEDFQLNVSQKFIHWITDTTREMMYYNTEQAFEPTTAEEELLTRFDPMDSTAEERELLQEALMNGGNSNRDVSQREMIHISSPNIRVDNLDYDLPSISRLIQYGLIKYISDNNERRQQQFRFGLGGERKILVEFIQRINILMHFRPDHLGPNRTYQERLIRVTAATGEIARLAEDFVRYRVNQGSTSAPFLAKWLKHFEIGESVQVEQLEGTTYRITVQRDGSEVNLADMGFGAGQLLSILFLLAINLQRRELEGNRIVSFQHNVKLIIEEPEANLHPRLQSLLAEMLLEAACTHWLAIVVETHSEYLIRRLQLLIAREQYPAEAVIIHYLDPTVNRQISILPDGKLSEPFGPGFLDEAGEGTLALHRIQREKKLK